MDAVNTASDASQPGQRYRFGGIVVDVTAHTLIRDGEVAAVEPKAFAVLLVLLRRAGELVRHDDLLDAVWGHRHVTPGVLTRAIAQLRHALDDDSQHPRYIQTQHGLGYRFVAALLPEPEELLSPRDTQEDLVTDAIDTTVADSTGDTRRTIDGPPITPEYDRATAASDVPPIAIALRPASRRTWWMAALLLVTVVVALIWYQRTRIAARPAEASIAVLPFTSLSSDKGDNYFAEGLAVEMHDALAGVSGLKVAACRTGSACSNRAADAKTLGKTLGVATVLDADVRREGSRVRISARLSDTRTGFTLWTGSYDRETHDVFALQSEIANEVLQSLLTVLPRDREALARRLAPTRNISAYDAYLKGLQRLQEPDNGHSRVEAIGFFREALAADPDFARAQAGICRAEIERFESARDSAAYERAQAACMRASGMDPGLREVSLALGELHRVRGESALAIEQYTKALDDISLRPAAYIGLARAESAQGRNDIALDYFERARKLRPADSVIYSEIGYHRYMTGDLPKAIESYRIATTLQPGDSKLWSSLGGLYLASSDTHRASEAFERSLAIKPNFGALSNLGTLRYDAGAYDEAADLYRRAAELASGDFRAWGNLGDALAAQAATAAQAQEPYRRAAQLADRYVGIKFDDAHALALLAWYRANLGEGEAARDLLARAEARATERGEVALWGAQTLALLGDDVGARERLNRAREADISLQRIQTSPVLRRLLAAGDATEQKPGG